MEVSDSYGHGRVRSSRDGDVVSDDDTQSHGVGYNRAEEEHPDDYNSHHVQESSHHDVLAASGSDSGHFLEFRPESACT